MNKRQVCFLMSGRAHLPYLMVALKSLRKIWQGRVEVYAWPESFPIASKIADSFFAECYEREPKDRMKRNSQFLDKIRLMQTFPKETTTIYLDADTMPVGNLDSLFYHAEDQSFCATQFNEWKSTGNIVSKRIRRLEPITEIEQKFVYDVLNNPWPSVNGGVFASVPESPVLKLWEEWTWAARGIFIADETVLHAVMAKFMPMDLFAVLGGGAYNCSPTRFQPLGLKDRDVVVWHGHGDGFVRPDKSKKGHAMWWPIYEQVLSENVADCQSWIDDVVAENKHMSRLEKPVCVP